MRGVSFSNRDNIYLSHTDTFGLNTLISGVKLNRLIQVDCLRVRFWVRSLVLRHSKLQMKIV
jgi:hypothetical protein